MSEGGGGFIQKKKKKFDVFCAPLLCCLIDTHTHGELSSK
jgi:hypothetical protein